jgi:hypothetical protein
VGAVEGIVPRAQRGRGGRGEVHSWICYTSHTISFLRYLLLALFRGLFRGLFKGLFRGSGVVLLVLVRGERTSK